MTRHKTFEKLVNRASYIRSLVGTWAQQEDGEDAAFEELLLHHLNTCADIAREIREAQP